MRVHCVMTCLISYMSEFNQRVCRNCDAPTNRWAVRGPCKPRTSRSVCLAKTLTNDRTNQISRWDSTMENGFFRKKILKLSPRNSWNSAQNQPRPKNAVARPIQVLNLLSMTYSITNERYFEMDISHPESFTLLIHRPRNTGQEGYEGEQKEAQKGQEEDAAKEAQKRQEEDAAKEAKYSVCICKEANRVCICKQWQPARSRPTYPTNSRVTYPANLGAQLEHLVWRGRSAELRPCWRRGGERRFQHPVRLRVDTGHLAHLQKCLMLCWIIGSHGTSLCYNDCAAIPSV